MVAGVELFLEKAESALTRNDLESFLRYIGNAEAVAASSEAQAQIAYHRAKGLFLLRRYKAALEAIEEALLYKQNEYNYIRLWKFKSCVMTYTGNFKESMRILKKLTTETTDNYLLSEIYLNMSWTLLESYKAEAEAALLEEAKLYLDTAYKDIEIFDNFEKKRIALTNYAEYFKLQDEQEIAIEMLEEALQYCTDRQLAELYNDLAELYIDRAQLGDLETAEKYLVDAELIATKYDNEFELANSLYLRGLLKLETDDFVQVMDFLYIAFHNFVNAGAFTFAFDCYNKISEVSNKISKEFVSSLKDKVAKQFEKTNYINLV